MKNRQKTQRPKKYAQLNAMKQNVMTAVSILSFLDNGNVALIFNLQMVLVYREFV